MVKPLDAITTSKLNFYYIVCNVIWYGVIWARRLILKHHSEQPSPNWKDTGPKLYFHLILILLQWIFIFLKKRSGVITCTTTRPCISCNWWKGDGESMWRVVFGGSMWRVHMGTTLHQPQLATWASCDTSYATRTTLFWKPKKQIIYI